MAEAAKTAWRIVGGGNSGMLQPVKKRRHQKAGEKVNI